MPDRHPLVKKLHLELLCPAQSLLLEGKSEVTLVNSNYRLVGPGKKTLWEWLELFSSAGLKFEDELKQLIAKELGVSHEVEKRQHEGYLGVTANTSYVLRKA